MKQPLFSFYTLGCRLNQAEEESMRRDVTERGYLATSPNLADFCIVNTCSVTALADKKSRQSIRKLKKENIKLKIVVTGCGALEAKDFPEVDLAIFNKDKNNTVDEIIAKYQLPNTNQQTRLNRQDVDTKYRTRALLKVQDGCNNFCAYCIVPFLRGREVSVPFDEIINEARKLDKLGYKELVISGVNVGRYLSLRGEESAAAISAEESKGDADVNGIVYLSGLLKEILNETSFLRIRLSSINPQDISDDIIELWATEPRLARHFHLSLQSGSNSVLKRMGRPYTADQYLEIVNNIYKKIPDMAITTDVIVGFPGETEEEFQETVSLINMSKLAKVHVFRYSNRQGTKASKMTNQIPAEKIKERAASLLRSTKVLEDGYRARFLGQEVEVLFEYKRGGFWHGLTSNYLRVKVLSDMNMNMNMNNTLKIVKFDKDNAC